MTSISSQELKHFVISLNLAANLVPFFILTYIHLIFWNFMMSSFAATILNAAKSSIRWNFLWELFQ